MEEDKYTFADGLRDFNTRGAYVKPVRMNKKIRALLLFMMEEDLENTARYFDEDHPGDEIQFDHFMRTMTWLKNKLGAGDVQINVKFDGVVAYGLLSWTIDKKSHHMYDDPSFEDALQWVTNQWNSRYAQSVIVSEYEKDNKFITKK